MFSTSRFWKGSKKAVLGMAVMGAVGAAASADAAIFTSKATGLYNAAGQTTWNEVGDPVTSAADTVTISTGTTVSVTTAAWMTGDSLTIADGGTLDLQNSSATTFALAALDLTAANTAISISRGSSGAGVTHTLGGTLTLGNGAKFTLSTGTNVTTNSAYGLNLSGTRTVTGNQEFAINNNGTGVGSLWLQGVISGTGSISKTGAGTLNLGNANHSFNGGLTVSNGIVSFSSNVAATGNSALGAGSLTLNGGTLQAGGSSGLSLNRNIAITAANSGIAASTGAELNVGGVISGGFSLILNGSGSSRAMFISQTANTFGGAGLNVKIAGAAVYVAGDGSLGNSSNSVDLAATLSFGNTSTVNEIYTTARAISLSAAGGLSVENGSTLNITGSLTGTNTLTINGSGTSSYTAGGVTNLLGTGANAVVVLNGNITGFTGALTVTNGTLQLGSSATLPTGFGLLNLANTAGVLMDMNNRDVTVGGIATGGSSGGNIRGNATGTAKTLTLNVTSNQSYAGVISDGGSTALNVTKTGSAIQTFTGLSTYTGVTTVSQGTIATNAIADGGSASGIGGASNAASNLILNGGTFQYTGTANSTDRLFSVGTSNGTLDSSGTGAINFSNNGSLGFNSQSGIRTLTLTGSNTGNNTLAAAIGDNGGATSITKSGNGTWVLSGNSNYSGTTNVTTGSLAFASNTAAGTSVINLNGGVIRAEGAARSLSNNVTLSISTALSGTFALGLGTLTVNGGDRTLTNSQGDTLTLAGVNLSENNSARKLTITGTANTIITNAVVNGGTGSGQLVKQGTGVLTLNGNNTYTGQTTLNGGTLLINGTHASAVTVDNNTNNTTAILGGTGTIGAAVALNAPAATRVTRITGATIGTIGTLTINNALTVGAGASLYFDVGAGNNNSDRLAGITNRPTLNATTGLFTINFVGAGFSPGSYTYNLVNYTGTAFSSAELTAIKSAWTVNNLPTNGTVDLASSANLLQLTLNITGTTNFGITSGDITFNKLVGAADNTATVSVTNSGTAQGNATFSDLSSPLTNPSSISNVAANASGTSNVIVSTAGYANGTQTLTVAASSSPTTGATSVNVSYRIGEAVAVNNINFTGATALTGESSGGSAVLASRTSVSSVAEVTGIDANINNAGADVSMKWRTKVDGVDIAPLFSDVVQITTTDTNYVLKMYYADDANENAYFLGTYVGGGFWDNAGNNAFTKLGAYTNQNTLGQWGIDTTNNYVWAVVSGDGVFAVIPEPASVGLLGLGAMGLLLRRRRR